MAAIYMWFEIYEEEYTTTLYPLEQSDAILLSMDFDGGYMVEMDQDGVAPYHEMVAGWIKVLLLEAPEQEDGVMPYHDLVGGWLKVLLLEAPEQEDGVAPWHELIDAELDEVLITTYMPDQGLHMDMDLDPGNCYMTSV